MKARLHFLLMTAAWGASAGVSLGVPMQWGQPVTGVQLGIEMEERPFKLGERIPVSVKFTNSTAMPRFPVGPIHLTGQVTVMDAKQQLIRRRDDLKREAQAKAGKITGPVRMPPSMYGAAIKPGNVLGYGVDLARDFALDQPGTYTVSVTGQVLSGMPFEPNSATHSLTSGVVVIQIMASTRPVVAATAPPLVSTSARRRRWHPPARAKPIGPHRIAKANGTQGGGDVSDWRSGSCLLENSLNCIPPGAA